MVGAGLESSLRSRDVVDRSLPCVDHSWPERVQEPVSGGLGMFSVISERTQPTGSGHPSSLSVSNSFAACWAVSVGSCASQLSVTAPIQASAAGWMRVAAAVNHRLRSYGALQARSGQSLTPATIEVIATPHRSARSARARPHRPPILNSAIENLCLMYRPRPVTLTNPAGFTLPLDVRRTAWQARREPE
jgi:hypothetical protein